MSAPIHLLPQSPVSHEREHSQPPLLEMLETRKLQAEAEERLMQWFSREPRTDKRDRNLSLEGDVILHVILE